MAGEQNVEPVAENVGGIVQPEQAAADANNRANGNEEELTEQPWLTSDVWPHFTRVRITGVMKEKCMYCRKALGGEKSNGTPHLRNQLKSCIQKMIHDSSQKILGPNYRSTGNVQLSASQYNSDVCRKELCSMNTRLVWLIT
ncbi:unnamed protein product [Linum trigynum]|uniref:BED-type domain-containing protein n=1 Tax=Linum trigynum TaxID=586398 RepID=A0AAV2CWH6_9ROSI